MQANVTTYSWPLILTSILSRWHHRVLIGCQGSARELRSVIHYDGTSVAGKSFALMMTPRSGSAVSQQRIGVWGRGRNASRQLKCCGVILATYDKQSAATSGLGNDAFKKFYWFFKSRQQKLRTRARTSKINIILLLMKCFLPYGGFTHYLLTIASLSFIAGKTNYCLLLYCFAGEGLRLLLIHCFVIEALHRPVRTRPTKTNLSLAKPR